MADIANYVISGLLVLTLLFYPSLTEVPINENQVRILITEEGATLEYLNGTEKDYASEKYPLSDNLNGRRLTINNINSAEAKIIIPEHIKLINVICNNPYTYKKNIHFFSDINFLICVTEIRDGSVNIEYLPLS